MKSILYATDYSDASVSAFKYAYALSKQLNMRLIITHVYDIPSILGTQLQQTFPEMQTDTLTNHRKRLGKFCKKHLKIEADNETIIIDPIENMSILSGIIAKATDWHIRMIIVGMKGEHAVTEMVIGSTAKKLITKAPCPVLTIPSGFELSKVKRLIYATDFELEDLKALEKVVALAKTFDAEIRVVHVTKDKAHSGASKMEWFKEMLENRISYDKLYFELLESEDVVSTLQKYSDSNHANIIAMLERAHKGFVKNWFRRDLVKQMASKSSIPLLSFNENNLQSLFF